MYRALLICTLLAQSAPLPSTASGDSGHQFVVDRDFPWFDAEKNAFRPLSPPTDWGSWFDWWPERKKTEGSLDLGALATILFYVMAAALIIWLAYLLYVALESPARAEEEQPAEAKLDAAQLQALPAAVRDVTDFLGEAQRLVQEGDYNTAMVFYFSWQLVALNQVRALELEVGKTNRQYLSETSRNHSDLRPLFYRSMLLFEAAFYGKMTIDSEDFLAVWNARDEFQTRLKTPGRHR